MFENFSDFHSSRCWLVVVGIVLLLLCCHNMYLHGVVDVVLLLVVLFYCYCCWQCLCAVVAGVLEIVHTVLLLFYWCWLSVWKRNKNDKNEHKWENLRQGKHKNRDK